ncbi:MAG: arginase [Gaiellaceae bacterium]
MSSTNSQPVVVIGAPLDLGAGRRGVDMGPSAIRYAGLERRLEQMGLQVEDWGNVQTPVVEATSLSDEHARFLPEVMAICEQVARLVHKALDQGAFPLVLGGDHSIALGSLGALASVNGPGGVLYVDAHGDLNLPETSPTGNVHGMVLSAALGLAGSGFESKEWPLPMVQASRIVVVGARSFDEPERQLVRELGVKVYTMSDIDRLGLEQVMGRALDDVSGTGFVHVSFDMDAVDPEAAPGVGTPIRGGLSYREAHLALELVAESGLAGSLDIVEVNPILDRENATAKLAVELVASALGARIL